MTKRVVVTGMGAITPLGHTAQESWAAAAAGKSGIDWLSHFDTSGFDVKVAGEVRGWDASAYLPHKEIRRRDRYQVLSHGAIMQAFAHASLEAPQGGTRERYGIVFGSSIGGMTSFSEQLHAIDAHGARRMAPFGVPSFMTTGASSMGSIALGFEGVSYIVTSACATGSDCIGHAYDQIRLGRADVMIAGAGEAPILPNAVAGFDKLGACSHEHECPQSAVKPFDRRRGGLVVSEGAAALVLEEYEHAKRRGALIYAELSGYGASSDAFHVVAPDPTGAGATRAMQNALKDAQLHADAIGYINAHGTGTPLNDVMETQAIKATFGAHAHHLPVSSTKSMTGHAMGASGAIEAIFSIFALQDQLIPPTINLHDADPLCDLDYVPHVARACEFEHVMSNAFGFGGHNSVLIFSRYRGK